MITEKAEFTTGTYSKYCPMFQDIAIGSVLCVGHSEMNHVNRCKYCVSYKEENTYHLKILDETIPIVSEVLCSRPGIQTNIFT